MAFLELSFRVCEWQWAPRGWLCRHRWCRTVSSAICLRPGCRSVPHGVLQWLSECNCRTDCNCFSWDSLWCAFFPRRLFFRFCSLRMALRFSRCAFFCSFSSKSGSFPSLIQRFLRLTFRLSSKSVSVSWTFASRRVTPTYAQINKIGLVLIWYFCTPSPLPIIFHLTFYS